MGGAIQDRVKLLTNILSELREANLPGSADKVFLFLLERSLLRKRRATREITIQQIGDAIGKGTTSVKAAIKVLHERGWVIYHRPGKLGCKYVPHIPNNGSVWSLGQSKEVRSPKKRRNIKTR